MPQQQTSSPGQGQRFDWWAAPAAATASEPAAAPRRTAVPVQPVPTRTAAAQPITVSEPAPAPAAAVPPAPGAGPAPVAPPVAAPVVPQQPSAPATVDSTEVYRAVQASAAFQAIRHSYRSFAFPVAGLFLGWYLLYVAAQAAAPGLMRTPVAGPLNVAWLLGLSQFVTTFLLTWLYARNARTKRDRAALGLRWDTQDQLR
ncbi:DUF485 domain-containing protein [Streptomyces sp. 1331.2]|uniref:DUF485 domain-containing protein n=1 Tax=Streptomyces sp. 1331.2 TaxID=1938835 RepID=UPI000BDA9C84|nr:DUF485 domain-containing protein [Streptomyces sp. 1331.2]SOB81786.1 Uncharacterized membrane protein, DUF485 family [Streptomyces sp. 1331.2]